MQKVSHAEKIRRGQAVAAAKGRHAGRPLKVTDAQIRAAIPLGTAAGAKKVKLSISSFVRRRRLIEQGESGVE